MNQIDDIKVNNKQSSDKQADSVYKVGANPLSNQGFGVHKEEDTSSSSNFKKKKSLKEIWNDLNKSFPILGFIIEIGIIGILAVVLVTGIKSFLVQPFIVDGISMEPNFHNKEYLLINEIGYRMDEPSRGDVIVFKYPYNEEKFYIKRIVCLPEETCKIQDGHVEVCDGKGNECRVLDESHYLTAGEETSGNVVVRLEEDQYFVLGDNRNASSDSRNWGYLEKDKMIGKVWIRAWPVAEAKVF